MVTTKETSEKLKQYLNNLDLYIVLSDKLIKELSKNIFYLMSQIIKYKKEKNILNTIKRSLYDITTFYIVKNNKLSFNNDIKSSILNKEQPYASNALALFSDDKDKYMLISFKTSKVLNVDLLSQEIYIFSDIMRKNISKRNIQESKFLRYYFIFLKSNNVQNSLEAIEEFLEIYIKKQLKLFFGKKYLSRNKLNIFH